MNVAAHPVTMGQYTYWYGILLDNDGHTVTYHCGHPHYYVTTAETCARYERDRITRQARPDSKRLRER